ncbi:MAG: glycosyltransferase [Pirellulales bacterium]|nr:glycosyltransferase [Pirellulales bacterium]
MNPQLELRGGRRKAELQKHVEEPSSANTVVDPGTCLKARIVLPAYNEAEALSSFLDEICETLAEMGLEHEILVVDDGSKDDTAKIVLETGLRLPVRLIQHEVNQGLAAAIRTGLVAGAENAAPGDVVITMDADRTQRPEIIRLMLSQINDGCDLVIASRYRPGASVIGVPWHRNLLSFGGRLLFQTLFPTPGVRDYTSGARAYRASLLQEMLNQFAENLVSEEGFSCMVDLLLKARSLRPRFGEVPITLRYDFKPGDSKMKVASNIWETLRLAVQVRTRGVESLVRRKPR